jgi:undecaprenyl-diphosphatase
MVVATNPLARLEPGILITLALIAGGTLFFAELADRVTDHQTRRFDRALMLALRHPGDLSPLGPPFVQEAARDITALGSITVLTLLTLGTCLYFTLDHNRPTALFLAASVVSGTLLSTLLKNIIHRPRPDIVPAAVHVYTTSFPSGHSMLSAVTYLTLGAILARAHERRLLKAFFLLTAVLLTTLVGISRVYLGVHYPTDVLAGWTAGSLWALICWLTARHLGLHRSS